MSFKILFCSFFLCFQFLVSCSVYLTSHFSLLLWTIPSFLYLLFFDLDFSSSTFFAAFRHMFTIASHFLLVSCIFNTSIFVYASTSALCSFTFSSLLVFSILTFTLFSTNLSSSSSLVSCSVWLPYGLNLFRNQHAIGWCGQVFSMYFWWVHGLFGFLLGFPSW